MMMCVLIYATICMPAFADQNRFSHFQTAHTQTYTKQLKSSPFSLPWSNEAAQKYKPGEEKAKAAKEAAAAKLASATKKPATIRGKKVVPEPEPVAIDPPRKKLFGLF